MRPLCISDLPNRIITVYNQDIFTIPANSTISAEIYLNTQYSNYKIVAIGEVCVNNYSNTAVTSFTFDNSTKKAIIKV